MVCKGLLKVILMMAQEEKTVERKLPLLRESINNHVQNVLGR